jgi:hypothetical protein
MLLITPFGVFYIYAFFSERRWAFYVTDIFCIWVTHLNRRTYVEVPRVSEFPQTSLTIYGTLRVRQMILMVCLLSGSDRWH